MTKKQFAFPAYSDNDGMTLRDYFAAKALQGLLAGNPETTNKLIVATKGSGSVSELAYVVADAMLKAREQ